VQENIAWLQAATGMQNRPAPQDYIHNRHRLPNPPGNLIAKSVYGGSGCCVSKPNEMAVRLRHPYA